MRFGMLGAMTLEDDDGLLRPVGTAKGRALLGVLLLRANRVVSADALKASLWGDHPPASAHASFHNHVTRLRRTLGGDRLRSVPSGYVLLVHKGELDAEDFQERLRLARAAMRQEDWETVGKETAAALTLWRGAPLADVPLAETVHGPELRRLEEARLQALEWHHESQLRLGRNLGLAADLAALAAEHPLHEVFHGQLMLALYRDGRQADALLAYERLRSALAETVGIDPAPPLAALHRRILLLDPVLTHQQDLSHATPAVRVPAQLPSAIADFTGRGTEIDQIQTALGSAAEDGRVTIVVHRVAGGGGMGKTTLAVHAAHLSRSAFPDGQLFADLRGTSSCAVPAETVLGRWLRDLGVPAEDVPADLDGRSSLFRSMLADRRMLLLLDDAGGPEQLRPLLPGTAGNAVLITSRRRLDSLPGSRVDLTELTTGEAYLLLAGIIGHERAAADPQATAEVLAVCDGLPLALRVAGARLAARPAWAVADLAGRLADRRRVLHELRADDVAVRTVLQVSYELLLEQGADGGAETGRAFRLLGLAGPGAIGAEAAAELLGCERAEAVDCLERLVDVHLLASPEPGRYQFHDLVRALALELCERTDSEEERRDALRRLVTWYVQGADAATELLVPTARRVPLDRTDPPLRFADYDQARAWCAHEWEHAVVAANQAHDAGLHDLAWKTAAVFWAYLRLAARWDDWLAVHRTGLAAARAAGDDRGQAWMHNGIASALQLMGDIPGALRHLRQSLEISERSGREFSAALLNNMGTIHTDLGLHEAALGHFERSLEAYRQTGDFDSVGAAHNNIGITLMHLGRFDDALTVLAEGHAVQLATSDHYSRAIGLNSVGDVYLAAARPQEAVTAYQQSIAIREQIGDRYGVALALIGLGDARADLDDPVAARDCWQNALTVLEEIGDTRQAGAALRRLTAIGTR